MNDMTQTAFDYSDLPAETAMAAKTAAERIKLRLKRTVEDIIEIGRELAAVKAELPHGKFLPWIASEFEMDQKTAFNFMSVYERFGGGKLGIFPNFKPTILYALSAPSTPDSVVEKAIEKAEAGESVTTAWVKEQKRLEAELATAKQRNDEWRDQSNTQRKQIRELQEQNDLLQSREPEIQVKIQTPADYEETKALATRLSADLDRLKKQQAALVKDQVAAKLKEREAELTSIDRKVKESETRLAGLQKQIDTYTLRERELKVHLDTIEDARKSMALLAANMEGFGGVIDEDRELRLWRALSGMMKNGAQAIDFFVGDSKPALTAEDSR